MVFRQTQEHETTQKRGGDKHNVERAISIWEISQNQSCWLNQTARVEDRITTGINPFLTTHLSISSNAEYKHLSSLTSINKSTRSHFCEVKQYRSWFKILVSVGASTTLKA